MKNYEGARFALQQAAFNHGVSLSDADAARIAHDYADLIEERRLKVQRASEVFGAYLFDIVCRERAARTAAAKVDEKDRT